MRAATSILGALPSKNTNILKHNDKGVLINHFGRCLFRLGTSEQWRLSLTHTASSRSPPLGLSLNLYPNNALPRFHEDLEALGDRLELLFPGQAVRGAPLEQTVDFGSTVFGSEATCIDSTEINTVLVGLAADHSQGQLLKQIFI